MSAYSIDSTNNTLTAATNWPAVAVATGGPWQHVEVCNLDGASTVTYVIAKADPTNPTSLAADTWTLPASISARAHDLDPTATALYIDVISPGTPKVAVTAW